jgi:hypothetical protein
MDDGLTLAEALEGVTETRSRVARQYELVPTLMMVCCAMLAGHHSLRAIAQWGRLHSKTVLPALGLWRRAPRHHTLHYVLRALDPDEVRHAIELWQRRMGLDPEALHVDGKVLRGSREGGMPALKMINLFDADHRAVLGMIEVATDESEAQSLLRLLGILPLEEGALLTGDAAYLQRDVCRRVVEQRADYLLVVKKNQPTLEQAAQDAFELAEEAGSSPL